MNEPNYGGISSVSVWLNHGTNFQVMLSQHVQPTHSRTDSTRCRVGHYKAEASMPDIYKYKYKYKYKSITLFSFTASLPVPLLVTAGFVFTYLRVTVNKTTYKQVKTIRTF